MIRYKISKGLRILFVGINPHPGSFRRGVPFSNNKMFWYLLNRAGLIRESTEELRDDKRLRKIFEKKFILAYRFGFVNLVDRPTKDISALRKREAEPGAARVRGQILRYKPEVACFIGKITYERFTGSQNCRFGWQDGIGRSKVYVMHFPIRGRASVRIRELRKISAPRARRGAGNHF